jgi:hypothetical protein
MSDKKTEFFFSYKGGRSKQVSKEEWEKEWLAWWNRTNADKEDADKESIS